MGYWGTGILDGDHPLDVIMYWEQARERGLDLDQAAAAVQAQVPSWWSDPELRAVSWLALAAAEMGEGLLRDETFTQALFELNRGADLATWMEGSGRDSVREREQALREFRQRLLDSMSCPLE